MSRIRFRNIALQPLGCGLPQFNVIYIIGLIAEVVLKGLSDEYDVKGGLVLVQAHQNSDVWMFGYVDGDHQGLTIIENTQPQTLCQEDIDIEVCTLKYLLCI